MSSSSPSPQENALIPTLFLMGVTALLVFFAIPRPYRDGALPTVEPTVIAAPGTSVAAVEPTPEDHLSLMAFGLEEVPSSGVQAGSRLFSTTCTACHGSDARGILGLGKPLVDSPFVNKLNDDELVAFLNVGRPASDPENTTKVGMPAKGGNPSLTDEDVHAIVDYIRSLNGATVVRDTVGEPTAVPTARPFEALDLNTFGSAPTSSPADAVPAAPASPTQDTAVEATPQAPSVEATPVTSYGYDTQGQATEVPTVPAAVEATPQAPSVEATPVTSYGYDTQGQATEVPAVPASAEAEVTPTTSYSYQTGPDTTNVPVTYDYDTQATPSQP